MEPVRIIGDVSVFFSQTSEIRELSFVTGPSYRNFSQNVIELNSLKCIKANSRRANLPKDKDAEHRA
jgi:hypothetical protein